MCHGNLLKEKLEHGSPTLAVLECLLGNGVSCLFAAVWSDGGNSSKWGCCPSV